VSSLRDLKDHRKHDKKIFNLNFEVFYFSISITVDSHGIY